MYQSKESMLKDYKDQRMDSYVWLAVANLFTVVPSIRIGIMAIDRWQTNTAAFALCISMIFLIVGIVLNLVIIRDIRELKQHYKIRSGINDAVNTPGYFDY
jgi:glucose uptake protein GlcU